MKTLKAGEVVYADTNAELLNKLLGTHYKAWMKSHIPLDVGEMLWMARLDGVVHAGWRNTMQNGQIIEEYVGGHPYPSNINLGLEVRKRAVFEKYDWGKFFVFRGVFEVEQNSSLTHRVLHSISDQITL